MINSLTRLFSDICSGIGSRNPWKASPVARISPAGRSKGTVALSYINWPLLKGYDSAQARGHTNAFEVTAMVEAFRSLGYQVEVVDYNNTTYRPPADCAVAVDIHSNLANWDAFLGKDCVRILHATGSHWLLWNRSELSRLEDIRDRKGVALAPRRQVEPTRSVETSDCVTVLGNKYTSDSFRFSGKPVKRVPISSAYEFAWPEGRDFERAKRRFLWVGSYGMVHKGLDLVLDAFAGMPDLELTVCGRPEKEDDFYRLYKKELSATPNIRLHGWIDMGSEDFREIARTHASVIYPSCAEGGAGSVIHCMHAGMVPICTEEASVDLGDFGLPIDGGNVRSVSEAARCLAAMSALDVERRSRESWEHVRRHHTREAFVKNYNIFAQSVLNRTF